MDFVASNGAQVVVGGKLVDREVFSHAAVCRLYRAVTMFDVLHLALFDRTNSFLLDDEAVFEREIDKNLPNPVRAYEVPSPETSIIKASVYVSDGTVMDMSYALTRELGGGLRVRAVGPQVDRRHAARREQSDGGFARSCRRTAFRPTRSRRSATP